MSLIPSATVSERAPAWVPQRRRHLLLSLSRSAFRAAIVLVLGLWSVLLLAWLTLHWGILPHIDDWRGTLESRASAALGLPVRIGKIEVRSLGWVPALTLTDVVLSDHAGREALRLPRVAAAVSPQSLLALRLTFSQLYIEGARLDVRLDAQGKLHVAGLDMNTAAMGGDGAAADWFFQQREFVIRHGTLRWVDERRAAPPLVLTDADLVVRNGLRHHDLRLDATPPAAWGERFSLRGKFNQPLWTRAGDWQQWSGTLHSDLPRVDVANLRQHVDLPFDLRAGEGALRLWMDVEQGAWKRATLDVALDEVALRLARSLDLLDLQQVAARLSATRAADGVALRADGLKFTTPGGQAWPASRLALNWRQNQAPVPAGQPGAPILGGDFEADRLDLAVMAGIAGRLPLPEGLRRALDEMVPEGQVLGLQASWTGPPEQPRHFKVKARGQGLSIAAKPSDEAGAVGRPGWRRADLDLQADDTGGEARLSMQNGALEFPGVFEEALVPLDHFSAQLVWQVRPVSSRTADAHAPPVIELLVKEARFANADVQGDLQARWRTGPGEGLGRDRRYPGRIELSGHIQQGQAQRVARYLPLGIVAEARDYVARAVRGGTVTQAQFRVKGDLWEFPYSRAADGEFHISAQAKDVDFAYVPPRPAGPGQPQADPGWPAFSQVSGELVFDRTSMEIRNAQAKLWGIELKGINGGIRDLLNHATLAIEGGGRGPLADAQRFLRATPLDTWTGHALRDANASGAADVKLALTIPLDDVDRTAVKGSVTLTGNELKLRPEVPLLANARGRVDFTQKGFTVVGGTARALGGDLAIDGGSQTDGSLRFSVQGVASAEGLRRATELGSAARFAGAASGQTPYRLQLGLLRGQVEMQLTSPLTGLALDLPAPLRKSAELSWPLRYQTTLLADSAGSPPRDNLRLELGSVLQADYQRDLSGDQPRVLRGVLAVGGEPIPVAQPGLVQAAARLGQVDLDDWQASADRLLGAGGGAAASGGYLPTDITLRAQGLESSGRRLTQVSATLQRRPTAVPNSADTWRATVQADQAQGTVEYRPATSSTPARLQARLARLALPPAEAEAVESLVEAPNQSIPALDIVVDDFELRGKKLGRLEIDAEHRGLDRRDWRLTRLNLSTPEAKLVGSGTWTGGGQRRMALDFRVDLADSGALVERLGMGRTLRGGKGKLQGQLAWTGSPLAPEWSRMTGSMQLALDTGQFLKAEPGAARLLGVLSLQSLPRRLTLDFRDVFQQGFVFDNVSGDIKLVDGIARTNNLRIRGLQAVVLVEGQADLKRETQDLRMVVVPEINAGTASLAYAAINPAIGLGTFLAQYVFRKPLQQAGTRQFQVSGSWDQPTVEPVERKAGEPLPEGLDSPAAAASVPASTP